MTTLGVVFDGVIRTQTDPLRKRAVLLLRLREGTLRAESLLGWLFSWRQIKWQYVFS